MQSRWLYISVGLFVTCSVISLIFIALSFSTLPWRSAAHYPITARFDDVSGLKAKAPLRIAGVKIGEVDRIDLNDQDFMAVVHMHVDARYANIPQDSLASIYTEGLLGSRYVNISPGFSVKSIHANGSIMRTHSAVVLEKIISQLLFSFSGKKKSNDKTDK
jgi:phospholipid/cholesterol/gamma-HCH transport system substrate-binding protein